MKANNRPTFDLQSDIAMRLGLLRHGETVWNSEKRVQGHGNSSLTKNGRTQIRAWAEQLSRDGWQRIVASDLGRVQETVAILNRRLDLPIHVDARLREQNWGRWEGMRVADVYEEFAAELAEQTNAGWDFRPPAGESRREVINRVHLALSSAVDIYGPENILVVCHLGVIKCCLYALAGRYFLPDEPSLMEKDCFHELAIGHSGCRISRINVARKQGSIR